MHLRSLPLIALVGCFLSVHGKDVQIVTYWGQNSAYGEDSREERDLVELCSEDSPFDVVNIGFIKKFFDQMNSNEMPGLDFAGHCNTPIDENHKTLYSCPVIERGIRECQKNGKKVLIAIGGPRKEGDFDSAAQAEKFAENVWNLFLGGQEIPDLRPFSSAVCDGVNLYIPGGSYVGYSAFVRHLFYLAKRDRIRKYIITASPSCNYPDAILGPAINKALDSAVKYINHLYIRFYGSNCGVASNSLFEESVDAWMSFARRILRRDGIGPLIFFGVPALERASPVQGCYQSTRELRELYKQYREENVFGGFMIWDSSWDQSNVQYGKTFAERLFATIENVQQEENENFDEEEEEERPIEPPATEPTPPVTLGTTQPTPATVATNTPEPTPPETPPVPEATPPPTPAPTPPPPPQQEQTDSSDENPYGDDDEMEAGDQEQPDDEEEQEEGDQEEPEETPEQEAAKDPVDEEEQQEEADDDNEDNMEDDPYQPRPPDMENRFPQNNPQPAEDGKAYQEESIPFSQAAKMLADRVEKEIRRKEWLRKQRKHWHKIHPETLAQTQMSQPASTWNQNNQASYAQSQLQQPAASYGTQQNNAMQQSNVPQVLQQQQFQKTSNFPQVQKQQHEQQQANWWASQLQSNPIANYQQNAASQLQSQIPAPQLQQNTPQVQQTPSAQQQNQIVQPSSRYPAMPIGLFVKHHKKHNFVTAKASLYRNRQTVDNVLESMKTEEDSVSGSSSGMSYGSGSGDIESGSELSASGSGSTSLSE